MKKLVATVVCAVAVLSLEARVHEIKVWRGETIAEIIPDACGDWKISSFRACGRDVPSEIRLCSFFS